MKINYQFPTETIEIEVGDDWGNLFFELNHQKYNINHKEARHHSSLEAHNVASIMSTSVEEEDIMLSGKNREQRFAKRIKIFSQTHPVIAWVLNKVFLVILIDIIANMTYSAIGQVLFSANVYEEQNSSSQVVYHIKINKNIIVAEDISYYYEVEMQ